MWKIVREGLTHVTRSMICGTVARTSLGTVLEMSIFRITLTSELYSWKVFEWESALVNKLPSWFTCSQRFQRWWVNKCIIRIPEKESKKNGKDTIFKEIMIMHFPELVEDMNSFILKTNQKKFTPRKIVMKL